MKKFKILFYNRFCCENQTYNIIAKDEKDAERLFWLGHNKQSYYDCIENIKEVKDEHFFTEEEILKNIER